MKSALRGEEWGSVNADEVREVAWIRGGEGVQNPKNFVEVT